MKKKQILFLFAASALFAACSSDELPNDNPGGGEEPTTEYLSSYTEATEDGLGISVGALNSLSTDTKSSGSDVYFDVIPDIDEIMSQFTDYVVEADDFYIRKNGEYLDIVPMESGGAQMPGSNEIRVTTTTSEGELAVRVQKLDLLTFNPDYNDDYTFEVYIWVKRTNTLYEPGTGAVADLFTQEQKVQWVGGEDNIADSGIDITSTSKAYLLGKNEGVKIEDPDGYAVRYNVYRGISGRPDFDEDGNYVEGTLGDTPYIKVSIHVNRLQDNQASSVTPIYPTAD